jgi:hypothetical protein
MARGNDMAGGPPDWTGGQEFSCNKQKSGSLTEKSRRQVNLDNASIKHGRNLPP